MNVMGVTGPRVKFASPLNLATRHQMTVSSKRNMQQLHAARVHRHHLSSYYNSNGHSIIVIIIMVNIINI